MDFNKRSYRLPVLTQPSRTEGPQGYLLRLAEENLLTRYQLVQTGITYDYMILQSFNLLPNQKLDNELNEYVKRISELKQSTAMVFNEKYARYCPLCLQEHNEWKIEWELYFYDVCHHHNVWLVDQCGSCGNKLNWNRSHINRCACGASLHYEDLRSAPQSMSMLASQFSQKVMLNQSDTPMSAPLLSTDIQQSQKLIRYLGNYMAPAPGRNPLKMKEASDLSYSWPVTTLATELLQNWPAAFHESLTSLERRNRTDGRPSLSNTFGAAYDYVFNNLKDSAFKEVRTQFELWIAEHWRGGVAKRNKRLIDLMLKDACWIPANAACDYLGISVQRLEMLINEGTIEGEKEYSKNGRKFIMVRKDGLESVKEQLFGMIDMTTAKDLLGLQKRRMRKLLTLLFKDVKKLGSLPNAPWSISRQEINHILGLTIGKPKVSIPDEDCIALAHVLKYWTWSDVEIANLIHAVRKGEICIINQLDTERGIAAWNFKLDTLKNWYSRHKQGLTEWMTITQSAKALGVKEQVAYELVNMGYLVAEVMPFQKKRGTRVKRSAIEDFNQHYVFATKVAEALNCSYRKVQTNLTKLGINPISGPSVDGLRQVLYKRDDYINAIIRGESISDLVG